MKVCEIIRRTAGPSSQPEEAIANTSTLPNAAVLLCPASCRTTWRPERSTAS
jgi:hypothetical protein